MGEGYCYLSLHILEETHLIRDGRIVPGNCHRGIGVISIVRVRAACLESCSGMQEQRLLINVIGSHPFPRWRDYCDRPGSEPS